MADSTPSGWRTGRGLTLAAIAVVLVIVGVVALVVGLTGQTSAPKPPPGAAGGATGTSRPSDHALTSSSAAPSVSGSPSTSAAPSPSGAASSGAGSSGPGPGSSRAGSSGAGSSGAGPTSQDGPIIPKTTSSCCDVPVNPFQNGLVLSKSDPVSIAIPKIGAQSSLLQLGKDNKGGIEVPPVDDPDSKAGWYKYSPTPGQVGPAVILGHVDSAKYGPGIFYKIGALRPGDTINVTRADRTVAVFKVDGVVSYPKDMFPTQAVYGNIRNAGLRLITCGGQFNPSVGHYKDNIVAYASLVSEQNA